jgi:hypothetical protein
MTLWLGSGLAIVLSDPSETDRAAQVAHADFLARQPNGIDPEEAWRRGGEGAPPGRRSDFWRWRIWRNSR